MEFVEKLFKTNYLTIRTLPNLPYLLFLQIVLQTNNTYRLIYLNLIYAVSIVH